MNIISRQGIGSLWSCLQRRECLTAGRHGATCILIETREKDEILKDEHCKFFWRSFVLPHKTQITKEKYCAC